MAFPPVPCGHQRAHGPEADRAEGQDHVQAFGARVQRGAIEVGEDGPAHDERQGQRPQRPGESRGCSVPHSLLSSRDTSIVPSPPAPKKGARRTTPVMLACTSLSQRAPGVRGLGLALVPEGVREARTTTTSEPAASTRSTGETPDPFMAGTPRTPQPRGPSGSWLSRVTPQRRRTTRSGEVERQRTTDFLSRRSGQAVQRADPVPRHR